MNFYKGFMSQVSSALLEVQATDCSGARLELDVAMQLWCEITNSIKESGNDMYFIGNGASAAMAAHMSADASKNGEIRAHCFNESSLITAISNDSDFKEIFAYPLSRYARKNDVLVVISSSGNSLNIIRAIQTAKEIGMKVITLSGMEKDNKSRSKGDLNFWAPSNSYGIVESTHTCLLHCWLDKFLAQKN